MTLVLLSILISPKSYAQDTEPTLKIEPNINLVLPSEHIIKYGGKTYYAFTPTEFPLVLKIYNNYTLLGNQSLLWKKKELNYQADIMFIDDMYAIGEMALDRCDKDRDYCYETLKTNDKIYKKEVAKEKIKAIITIVCVGVGGIGLGFLIGFFAAQ